jgi:hypothetical protein
MSSKTHCKNQLHKFETNIPRKGIARPQSQFPQSTFMCLCIFPRLICLFCCRKYVDRSWKYKKSPTEIGTEAALIPEKEYIYGIFVAVRGAASGHSTVI